jgi:membrane-bound acyltransferase YfiQ involved in biofilm formation
MSALDIFAWVVLVILVVSAVTLWVVLARLPGRIAARRGHPYKDAVTVAGWLGALFAGILWPLALIWAFATRDDDRGERRP